MITAGELGRPVRDAAVGQPLVAKCFASLAA
jgi:hypothetical protein